MTGEQRAEPLVWGILGAARIAGKALIPAIRAAGGEVAAVGASTRERAGAFARDHGIAAAHEGYEAVLNDDRVSAVYIPLANGLHKEWAIRAARAGKPVLCEKPLVMTSADAEEIRSEFAAAGVPLLEAFMWRHHRQIEWAREQIAAGRIGELRRVEANFSFMLDRPDDYRWRGDQGGGALLDVGCYCANAMRLFFGGEPRVVSARSHMTGGAHPADGSTAGWLDFGEGRFGAFTCSFTSGFCQGLELLGTRGRMWFHRPWLHVGMPVKVLVEAGDEQHREPFEGMNAYSEMVKNFTRLVRDGSHDPFPAEDGTAQSRVMEGLVASGAQGGTPVGVRGGAA